MGNGRVDRGEGTRDWRKEDDAAADGKKRLKSVDGGGLQQVGDGEVGYVAFRLDHALVVGFIEFGKAEIRFIPQPGLVWLAKTDQATTRFGRILANEIAIGSLGDLVKPACAEIESLFCLWRGLRVLRVAHGSPGKQTHRHQYCA